MATEWKNLKKDIECKRKGCKNRFDQRVWWHYFCSPKCRIAHNDIKEQAIRKPYRAKKRGKCHCGCGRPVGKGLTWLSEVCWRSGGCPSEDYHKTYA